MKRAKRRYLALQVDSDDAPSQKELLDAIWSAITKLYGEYGASQTSLALVAYDMEKKLAVIRASLATLDLIRASLASVTVVAGKDGALHVLAVSGTLRALHKKIKW